MEIPQPIFFTMVSMFSVHDSWPSIIVPNHFTLSTCSIGSPYKFKLIFSVDDSLCLDPKIIYLVFEMFGTNLFHFIQSKSCLTQMIKHCPVYWQFLQHNTMWNHQHTFVQLLYIKKYGKSFAKIEYKWSQAAPLWDPAVQVLRMRPADSVINPVSYLSENLS